MPARMPAYSVTISIHALRKESDDRYQLGFPRGLISIHALRKESDSTRSVRQTMLQDFNPRSP